MFFDIFQARTGNYKQSKCVFQPEMDESRGKPRLSFIFEKLGIFEK